MANVIITIKIMPDSPNEDLAKIEKLALEKIKNFTGLENYKKEIEPVAFGLKALKITFVSPEEKGSTEKLEEDLNSIKGVNSVEVIDVRRAVG